MEARTLIEEAIRIAGSEAKLGAACGCKQQTINKAKKRGYVSAEIALGIHRATEGAVPASSLRPDIWTSPEHVPARDGGADSQCAEAAP